MQWREGVRDLRYGVGPTYVRVMGFIFVKIEWDRGKLA